MKSQKHSKSALGILWRLALTFAFLLWALPGHSEEAKRMRIGGIVHVEATVSPDGSVTAVKAVSGNKMLSPAAEEAVKRWKFAPGDGPATVGVDINFELN
jgi:TonB family protein